jgi:hypothetical protein
VSRYFFAGNIDNIDLRQILRTKIMTSQTDQSRARPVRSPDTSIEEKAGSTMLELKTFLDSSRLGATLLAGRINS